MAVDFYFAWVDQYGQTHAFNEPLDFFEIVETPLSYEIPEQTASGSNGGYDDDSCVRPRDITVNGTMTAPIDGTPTDLRNQMDTLASWFPEGGAGKFYRNSDRYINARVSRFGPDGPYLSPGTAQAWTLALHAGDPFYYDVAPQAAVDITPGAGLTVKAVTVTAGGSAVALPVITLLVSTPGHAITISTDDAVTNPQSMEITPSVAGTYVIDPAAGTVTVGGADYLSDVTDGDFQRLAATVSTTITLTLATADVLGAGCSLQWTRRWRTAS